ncbi:unnamed protein product [Rotaria socialis]|uniref:Uncharacterized protein n=1 Tax=Rotaria socialis TaxID=392032 RepID=A0A817MVB3_9BILA|nr:unnamed protein product [Rotaria socialis]CAF3592107.1 unnamed protein product [Rotaria socialis]CAF3655284.1 unnamed protein product [Rotaria socialis]CAF4140526.1 unnamed protein product [Rotaria socialis]CAF4496669.1 unnamed protein product [Rotaria socialis]
MEQLPNGQFFERISPYVENQIHLLSLKDQCQLYLFNEFFEQQTPASKAIPTHRSLKLNKNKEQPYQKTLNKIKSVFQLQKNLRYLTLIDDRSPSTYDTISLDDEDRSPVRIGFHFERLSAEFCINLTELRLFVYFDTCQTLEQIILNRYLSTNLTHLTLVSVEFNDSVYDERSIQTIERANLIKQLLLSE